MDLGTIKRGVWPTIIGGNMVDNQLKKAGYLCIILVTGN